MIYWNAPPNVTDQAQNWYTSSKDPHEKMCQSSPPSVPISLTYDRRKISIKNRKKNDYFFLHIRLDLVEFASQMVLFSKFRVDTAENGPVKVGKVQFSKYHFSPSSANFSILSSFTVRTRRDLAPGSKNFPKIHSKMTISFSKNAKKNERISL